MYCEAKNSTIYGICTYLFMHVLIDEVCLNTAIPIPNSILASTFIIDGHSFTAPNSTDNSLVIETSSDQESIVYLKY